MGPLDPALVGIAMLLCFGLAVGKDIGKDPNTGCGKGAVVAGGGAVAGGAALSKAGLFGSKAASVGAKVASVGAKATGVGATATLADDVARVGAMSDDVAGVGATVSDDVARTAASGGHGVDGLDGVNVATHAAQSANHLGHVVEHSSVSESGTACTHANVALRGLTSGTIPSAFQGAIVQSMDPAARAWSSDEFWIRMKTAVAMDPCDPSIDSLDLTPLQRAAVIDANGNYVVLVLEGGRMLVEFNDGAKLLLTPVD